VAPLRVIFSGGGTGGHLFPALAIADEIKRLAPGAEVLFIGTADKLESRVVPAKGYAFRSIWISGFRRGLCWTNFLFPVKTIVSYVQARSIIKNFKPDVVVGTGGYVSGPVLRAAVRLKVPTLIQEQNSYPGITTRLLAREVDEIHLTFEGSRPYISRKDRVFVTGNPTRADLDAASRADAFRYFGFDMSERKKTVLIFGGSLGARPINRGMELALDHLVRRGVRIVWQTGEGDIETERALCRNYSPREVWVGAFIDRMDYAYALSDLVVCRAGATTIAELTRLGKPAILIPYPRAAANHQVENAKAMVEQGAADTLPDEQIGSQLEEKIMATLEDARLKAMSFQSKKLGKPDAAADIARRAIGLARARGAAFQSDSADPPGR